MSTGPVTYDLAPPLFFPNNPLKIEDLVLNVFTMIIADIADDSDVRLFVSLSFVSKLWKRVVFSSHLWELICQQTGIPVPFDISQSLKAYCYATTSLFFQQLRACQTPKIETFNLGNAIPQATSGCIVRFVQDCYLIRPQKHKIFVIDFKNNSVVKTIETSLPILSYCISQKDIYLCLTSRHVKAYRITSHDSSPFLEFDGHTEDNVSQERYPDLISSIMLVSNDHYLVSHSYYTIKQWNRFTGACLAKIVILNGFCDLQINRNQLYMKSSSHGRFTVSVSELNSCNLNFIELKQNLPFSSSKIKFSQYLYHHEDEELSGSWDHDDTQKIVSVLDLDSKKTVDYKCQNVSSDCDLDLQMISRSVAVISYDICNQSSDDKTSSSMMEIVDFQHGIPMYMIQHSMISCVSFFQDTLLYLAAENQVVQVTFPLREVEQNKRKINLDDHEVSKNKRLKREQSQF